jgi:hypothetical protein
MALDSRTKEISKSENTMGKVTTFRGLARHKDATGVNLASLLQIRHISDELGFGRCHSKGPLALTHSTGSQILTRTHRRLIALAPRTVKIRYRWDSTNLILSSRAYFSRLTKH